VLTEPNERVRLEARPHAVVLARPVAAALPFVALGPVGLTLPWPFPLAGALLMTAGALLAVGALWRWERTHLVVTTDKLILVRGTLRRRAAAVRLARVEAIELEQTLAGRLLGYGTLSAGGLEIPFVSRPREVYRLLHP